MLDAHDTMQALLEDFRETNDDCYRDLSTIYTSLPPLCNLETDLPRMHGLGLRAGLVLLDESGGPSCNLAQVIVSRKMQARLPF